MDYYSIETASNVPVGLFTGFNRIKLRVTKRGGCPNCSSKFIGVSSESEFITKDDLADMLIKLSDVVREGL